MRTLIFEFLIWILINSSLFVSITYCFKRTANSGDIVVSENIVVVIFMITILIHFLIDYKNFFKRLKNEFYHDS